MFHRHRHAATPVAATTPVVATTPLVAPAIVPVAPAPPGPIYAFPFAVPLQQVQQSNLEPSGGGLLNKVKDVASTAASTLSTDTKAKTEANLQPLNPPVAMAPAAPSLPAQELSEAPVNFLKEERPAVVKERIIPLEEESIQPVIHREIEQREIHEILQPIHERQFMPATVEEKQLQAEYRPVVGGYAPRQATAIAPSVEYATPSRTQIVRPPIIEETIRKTIIEEVQPVIHREVVKPHIIRQTQPIFEKIVEPEVILKETRPMIERAGEYTTFQQAQLPATTLEKQYFFEIDQKTKLKPVGATIYPEEGTRYQTFKGYPGAK
jgi:hypothetical protein